MKKQIPDIWVAFVILAVLGGVFYLYGRGLLGEPRQGKRQGPPGGAATLAPPVTGMRAVNVTTLAGRPEPGYADGVGKAARFSGPAAVAIGPGGVIFVADTRNNRIRAVRADGTVTTVAGSGPTNSVMGSFADGPALEAKLWCPAGVAVADNGTVYFSDAGNHRIRVLRNGRVTTLAGGETARDATGLHTGGYADGPGQVARFRYPAGICLAADGAVLVADAGNRCIRRVAPDGTTTTLVAGGGQLVTPTDVTLLADGSLAIADPGAGAVFIYKEGVLSRLNNIGPATGPAAVCQGGDGALYLACINKQVIIRTGLGMEAKIWAGVMNALELGDYRDGPGNECQFWTPCDIVKAPDGSMIIADFGNNCIRKLTFK